MKTDLPMPYADEEWIEVYGHPRYLISTYGRVYCPERRQLLRDYVTSGPPPRRRVTLLEPGGPGPRSAAVAVEVLAAFSPTRGRLRGHVPAFLDGDPQNCRLDNLRWVSLNSAEHREALALERERAQALEREGAQAEEGATAPPQQEEESPARRRHRSQPAMPTREAVAGYVTASVRTPLSAQEREAIRDWAAKRGVKCAPRGRIPADVLRAYDHEHRREDAPEEWANA